MSMYQTPPDSILVDGVECPVDTDFRVWVEFQSILTGNGSDEDKAGRIYDLMKRLGLPPSKETLDAMIEFYAAASTEHTTGGKRAAAFDFEKDSEYIYAAFKGAYGIDLTTERIHWWRFKALFKTLPDDCQICKIMGYRTIEMKDVPKSQRKFYREMKARYSLGAKTSHRTEQDMRDYVKRRYEEAQARMSALRSCGQPSNAGAKCESG